MSITLTRQIKNALVLTRVLLYFSGMSERRRALNFQQDFFKRAGGGLQFVTLFNALPMVAFFAKDERSRFVCANTRTLKIFNLKHEWLMLGKKDCDFYPVEISASYLAEDQLVMRTRKTLTSYTQLVPDITGLLRWYIVSKAPLQDEHGRICGVAIVMHEMNNVGGVAQPFQQLEPALRHLHANFREPVETKHLAALTHLSESQFVRLFRKLLGETPMRYLIRQRIHAACQDLVATNHTAGAVALDCGFYDQSAFTRAFRSLTGQTPSAYRQQHLIEIKSA